MPLADADVDHRRFAQPQSVLPRGQRAVAVRLLRFQRSLLLLGVPCQASPGQGLVQFFCGLTEVRALPDQPVIAGV